MAAMELLCQTPSFRHARNARAGIDDHGQTSWNSSLPCGGDVQGQAEHRSTPMKHVQIVSTDSLGFIKCEEMTHHPAKASTRILSVYIYIYTRGPKVRMPAWGVWGKIFGPGDRLILTFTHGKITSDRQNHTKSPLISQNCTDRMRCSHMLNMFSSSTVEPLCCS